MILNFQPPLWERCGDDDITPTYNDQSHRNSCPTLLLISRIEVNRIIVVRTIKIFRSNISGAFVCVCFCMLCANEILLVYGSGTCGAALSIVPSFYVP